MCVDGEEIVGQDTGNTHIYGQAKKRSLRRSLRRCPPERQEGDQQRVAGMPNVAQRSS